MIIAVLSLSASSIVLVAPASRRRSGTRAAVAVSPGAAGRERRAVLFLREREHDPRSGRRSAGKKRPPTRPGHVLFLTHLLLEGSPLGGGRGRSASLRAQRDACTGRDLAGTLRPRETPQGPRPTAGEARIKEGGGSGSPLKGFHAWGAPGGGILKGGTTAGGERRDLCPSAFPRPGRAGVTAPSRRSASPAGARVPVGGSHGLER